MMRVHHALVIVLAVAAFLIFCAGARAETKLHVKAYNDGSLFVELRDENTGQKLDTILRPERVKAFTTFLAKHGYTADRSAAATTSAPPDPKKGCGFGDFFSGNC